MYFYIKGKITHKSDGFVVVETGGVGYKIAVSDTTYNLLKTDTEATVYTYLYLREDIMDLYGFSTLEEKNMFIHLISVSGVGPKAALSILSLGAPAKIAAAVITNDAKTIQKAQGIGAKIANRIVLELRDKLKTEELDIPEDICPEPVDKDRLNEAVNALIVLGYTEKEAVSALAKADLALGTEELIKFALKNLF